MLQYNLVQLLTLCQNTITVHNGNAQLHTLCQNSITVHNGNATVQFSSVTYIQCG